MNPIYFKTSLPQGEIYIQARYFSPYKQNICYELLVLRTNALNQAFQRFEECSKEGLDVLDSQYSRSSQSEFEVFQERHFLGGIGNRKKLFDQYYNVWKEYYVAKQKAVEAVRKSNPPNNYYYYERLEEQANSHNVYGLRKKVADLMEKIRTEDSPVKSEIFREARSLATHHYVTNKF